MSNAHVNPAFDLDGIYASLRVTPPNHPLQNELTEADEIPGSADIAESAEARGYPLSQDEE